MVAIPRASDADPAAIEFLVVQVLDLADGTVIFDTFANPAADVTGLEAEIDATVWRQYFGNITESADD